MFEALVPANRHDPSAEMRAERRERFRSKKADYIKLGLTYEYWCELIDSGVMAAYHQQRSGARQRGVAWKFTFHEWWKVWTDSGKWEQRGTRDGCYVMARYGDVGPYAAWNVRIATHNENMAEAQVTRKRRAVSTGNNLGP